MFRYIALIIMLVAVGVILVHAVTRKARHRVCLAPVRGWQKLIYLFAFIGVAAMSLTGLLSVILHGPGSIGGWTLWYHLAAAPIFIMGIVIVAYIWAERSRWGGLKADDHLSSFTCCTKAMFWLMVTCAFITISVMLLAMLPLLDSFTQYLLVRIHRWSALLLTASMLVHAYCVLVCRPMTVTTTSASSETTPA